MSNNNAVIRGTETRVLRSDLSGKEYLISLGLPHLYLDEPDKKWPVVYLVDANLYFGMVTDMVRSMSWCGMTQDAIVVGVGYVSDAPLNEAWHEVLAWRSLDLTPVRDESTEKEDQEWLNREVQTGGANLFLRFIEEDLMPLIETEYRVDGKESSLIGHSYGGLFTLYALFQKPTLFKNFVACSPSTWYKDKVILDHEDLYASRRKSLPARLYMTIGELEEDPEKGMVSGMYRLASQLESRKYKRFFMEKRLFPDEDHCTVIAPSFQAGLKWALKI